jgi:hypothetical protein
MTDNRSHRKGSLTHDMEAEEVVGEAGADGVVAARFGGGADVEEERQEADTRCYEL